MTVDNMFYSQLENQLEHYLHLVSEELFSSVAALDHQYQCFV